MNWTERELKEIKQVIGHLGYALFVATGKELKLDVEREEVHLYMDGKCIKKISISGDNASGVFTDVLNVLTDA